MIQPAAPNRFRQTYCGPTALAVTLGITREDCGDLVNSLRGAPEDTPIVGMYNHEMISVLSGLGCGFGTEEGVHHGWTTTAERRVWSHRRGQYEWTEGHDRAKRETLNQFYHRVLAKLGRHAVSIVNISNHYVTFVGSVLVDTRFQDGIEWSTCRKYKRTHVPTAWIDIQLPEYVVGEGELIAGR